MIDGCPHPFPLPYPDENLYSLFCRYHVRSGNHSVARTKEELFGKPFASLTTSHISPYLLQYSNRWCRNNPRGWDDFSLKRTTISLFSFLTNPDDNPAYAEKPFIKPVKKSCAFQNTEGPFLRYCPACANAERKIYGEPYWHLSHQIKMITHCHVHNTKLLESNVHVRSTAYNFIPAFHVLDGKNPIITEDGFRGSAEEQIESDYLWLLSNGHKLKGKDTVEEKYYNTYVKGIGFAEKEMSHFKRVHQFNTAYRILRYRYSTKYHDIWNISPAFRRLISPILRDDSHKIYFKNSIESNILYMHLIYGGVENFYQKEYLNSETVPQPFWLNPAGKNLLQSIT